MSVRARVTVTLEIAVGDHWGADVKAEQVRRQAIESALGAIRRGMTVNMVQGEDRTDERGFARVIGDPKVEAIITVLQP
jgi:hypothetical protein